MSTGSSADRGVVNHPTERELESMLASLPPVPMPEDSWQRIDAMLAALPPLGKAATQTPVVGAAPDRPVTEEASNVVPLRPKRWYDSAGARVAVAAGAALVAVGMLTSLGPTEPEPTVPAVSAPRLLAGEAAATDQQRELSDGAQQESGAADASAPPSSAAPDDESLTDASPGADLPEEAEGTGSAAADPNRVRAVLTGPPAAPLRVLGASEGVDAGVAGADTWTVAGPVANGTVVSQDGMTLAFDSPPTAEPGVTADPVQPATSVTLSHPAAVRVVRVTVSDAASTAVYAEDGDGELTAMTAGAGGAADPVVQRVTVFYDVQF